MKPSLTIIKNTHRPVIDIYADWRAKVEATDWAAVHIRGDRNPPLELGPSRKGWR